ncbi:NADH ubiquinone oxidoreductase, partial [Trifolium pratense]
DKLDNEKEALEFNALGMFGISSNILSEVKTMRLKGRLEVLIHSREQIELEARREQVRQNVALLKKEEEERKAKEGNRVRRVVSTGVVSGPDLNSFMRQFPVASEGNGVEESSGTKDDLRNFQDNIDKNAKDELDSSEPTGSGASYRPGTWQPPT